MATESSERSFDLFIYDDDIVSEVPVDYNDRILFLRGPSATETKTTLDSVEILPKQTLDSFFYGKTFAKIVIVSETLTDRPSWDVIRNTGIPIRWIDTKNIDSKWTWTQLQDCEYHIKNKDGNPNKDEQGPAPVSTDDEFFQIMFQVFASFYWNSKTGKDSTVNAADALEQMNFAIELPIETAGNVARDPSKPPITKCLVCSLHMWYIVQRLHSSNLKLGEAMCSKIIGALMYLKKNSNFNNNQKLLDIAIEDLKQKKYVHCHEVQDTCSTLLSSLQGDGICFDIGFGNRFYYHSSKIGDATQVADFENLKFLRLTEPAIFL